MSQQFALFNSPQTELTSDDYYTPKWIFDTLDVHFDIDVAAPDNGPAFTPCTTYYTKETDGLTQEWSGNVFMNPPFSNAKPWVEKFIKHNNGIAILPFAKSKWFNDLWDLDIGIVALPSSMKYDNPTGKSGSIFLPSMMLALNEPNIAAISKIGKVR